VILKKKYDNRAASGMEYIALVIFLLAAMLVFQRYIYRGFAGGWKKAGDTFGHGRQFDPRPFGVAGLGGGSLECYYDYTHCQPGFGPPCTKAHMINAWIDKRCVETPTVARPYRCDCTLPWRDPEYQMRCPQCLVGCINPACG